jgi:hypothetical protein
MYTFSTCMPTSCLFQSPWISHTNYRCWWRMKLLKPILIQFLYPPLFNFGEKLGRKTFKLTLKNRVGMCPEFIWIRTKTSGGVFWTRRKYFRFIKGGELTSSATNSFSRWTLLEVVSYYQIILFALNFTTLSLFQRTQPRMVRFLKNNELERIFKDAFLS